MVPECNPGYSISLGRVEINRLVMALRYDFEG